MLNKEEFHLVVTKEPGITTDGKDAWCSFCNEMFPPKGSRVFASKHDGTEAGICEHCAVALVTEVFFPVEDTTPLPLP